MGASVEQLERLYRERYVAFVNIVASVTDGYDAAHDGVQEAFARALERRSQFRSGSLQAWVLRIALNGVRDARRRSGREVRELGALESWAPAPERDAEVTA